MVGHTGARLLADPAEATGLTAEFSAALGPLRTRDTGHVPGRIAVDLAVMIADGGETITDLAVLRDQSEVFGPVASTPTAWRPHGSPAQDRSTRSRPFGYRDLPFLGWDWLY